MFNSRRTHIDFQLSKQPELNFILEITYDQVKEPRRHERNYSYFFIAFSNLEPTSII